MSDGEIYVERLSEYSAEDARGIGRLMPFLSTRLGDEPVPEALLTEIINSPYHDQLVARLDSKIVGSATLNILMGPAVDKIGYLEDFVTDPEVRMGVGDQIWSEIMLWCAEHHVDLTFTSKPEREKAHRFYLAHGATIKNSTVFKVVTNDLGET